MLETGNGIALRQNHKRIANEIPTEIIVVPDAIKRQKYLYLFAQQRRLQRRAKRSFNVVLFNFCAFLFVCI